MKFDEESKYAVIFYVQVKANMLYCKLCFIFLTFKNIFEHPVCRDYDATFKYFPQTSMSLLYPLSKI